MSAIGIYQQLGDLRHKMFASREGEHKNHSAVAPVSDDSCALLAQEQSPIAHPGKDSSSATDYAQLGSIMQRCLEATLAQ